MYLKGIYRQGVSDAREKYIKVISLTICCQHHIVEDMARIKLDGFQCERCGHKWLPADIDKPPRVCPKCKSPYWERPRKEAKPEKKRAGKA